MRHSPHMIIQILVAIATLEASGPFSPVLCDRRRVARGELGGGWALAPSQPRVLITHRA